MNRELEMLNGPNPTHPEYLRQLECVTQYRDAKVKYEGTLFQYRTQSLLNKSLAERAQAHSTYFQSVRDLREKYSGTVSKQFYAIQRDRFKTEEISPHHSVPFPTRRSEQIAQQSAYNQEVSILSGVAKYVGFPAAPELSAARPAELEEDLEKMGVSSPFALCRSQLTGCPRSPLKQGRQPHNLQQHPVDQCRQCQIMSSVRLRRKHFWSKHHGRTHNTLFINSRCHPNLKPRFSIGLRHSQHQQPRSAWSTSMRPMARLQRFPRTLRLLTRLPTTRPLAPSKTRSLIAVGRLRARIKTRIRKSGFDH